MSARAEPLGGPIVTRPFRILFVIFALGAALILWRLVAGLGATTALSDGYPWGLWIAFDVVTGTAFACGGYAMAILVYIFNKGKYHPLVRSAILTSALGYTMAGISVVLDIGRPWQVWKVPLFFWSWNLNSALLEVALCIMAYVFVLWIELSPAFLERWKAGPEGKLQRFSAKAHPIIERYLIWIIALGMLLPTMHQSSLGSLILLTGPKLHPLWQTPLLPLLFLVSSIAMGYAAVVFESSLSTMFFRRRPETEMLAGLSGAMLPVLAAFLLLRIGDLVVRGQIRQAFVANRFAVSFWVEIALMIAPLFLLASRQARRAPGNLFRAAMLMMLAGGLYRFNTYLVAYRPADDVHYFPSVPEFLITVGLIALEIIAYIVIVKTFPILSGSAPAEVRVRSRRER
ncbi:MAG TPA: Ni/Fe-hydrogenase cytochrome b subunit [Thermoanaerobaculia bacterium]|nr:Ni/Fe-hydrogenase cytochrome b subunit [Thermoanaerobaculia bacterium]